MGQILYYNGTILTMEDQKPCVEAVLTENGRITDAGTYKDLLERAGSQVRKGDLQGNVMVPGFIDPHSHFTACASNTMEVNLDGAENFDTIISRIQDFIRQRKIPEGQWVQASGYDHNCLKEHTHPRRMVLDQAAPRNPLIMKHQSGHMGVLNTMALNQLGITPDTVCPQGGVIEIKDKTITGYMEEAAFLKYQNQVPMPDKEEFLQAYSRAQELYASHGITTVQEGLLSQRLLPLYGLLAGSGLLKLDLVAYGDIRDSKTVTEQLNDNIRIYKNH
ncbi:MAG: amidohydrolase family protein, partial [Clostridium sp.]|nr:amidohydrolase family protein [Clostridium sp.]